MEKDTQLLTYALKKLARREQSEHELKRALATKSAALHPAKTTLEHRAIVEQVLAECQRQQWQSDERFAAAMVRHYTSQQKGLYAILHHLTAHNISDTIQNAIVAQYDYQQELTIARALMQKKTVGEQNVKSIARGLRFLQQRGFSRDTIASIRQEEFGTMRY